MIKAFLLLITFLCSFPVSFAQTLIRGKVVDAASKHPIGNANVLLKEKGSPAVKGYTLSDDKGNYKLAYKGLSDSLLITVTGFNLREELRMVRNKSQQLDFFVENKDIELKEVIVKAPKIRPSGDTLNYNVGQFVGKEDRSIGDVLRKMPGIEVKADGTILYQNRPISKFYIENLDMLQGRYGIATNNIEAKDVAAVQVMEHHQPIKALIGKEFVDEAALNLKLKESVKGIFLAKAQLGVGAKPLLLSNELLGMYFSRTMQNLSMYKGDNSGRDVATELKYLYAVGANSMNANGILNIISPVTPQITQQRSLFNDTHLGTFNNLKKFNDSYTLTTHIGYMYDRPEKKGYSLSEYYLGGDSVVSIAETMKTGSYKNKFNTELFLTSNTDNYYFNNELKLNGEWDRDNGYVNTNGERIVQSLNHPDYSVTNDLDLLKTKGKNVFRLKSFIGYKDITQTLEVTPLLFKDIFQLGSLDGRMRQKFDFSTFYTRNSVSGATKGRFSFDYKAEFNASFQRLTSGLEAWDGSMTYTRDSLYNAIRRNYLEGILSVVNSYDLTPTMNIRFHLPLRYVFLHRDSGQEQEKDKHFFYVDPFLNLSWQISARLSATIMYAYEHQLGKIEESYTQPIMTNYRSLLKNDGLLEKIRNHNVSGFLSYKNPFTTFFGSLTLFYNHTHSNLLGDYRYNGILTRRSSVAKPNGRDDLSANFRVGKEIDVISSKLSLGVSYYQNKSQQLSQGEIANFNSRRISFSPDIRVNFGEFANFHYQFDYSLGKNKIDVSDLPLPAIKTWSQKAELNLFPVKNMVTSLCFDHFYNNTVAKGSRTMWFGDIGIKYRLKKVEFMLDWTNIFNTDRYTSVSYKEIGKYFYSYELRPREILFRIRFSIL